MVLGKQATGGQLKEHPSKLAVLQLEGPEPLLRYVPLHLFILFHLTRSCHKLLHTYSLLATTNVCPLASYIYARAHIASHLQHSMYQE
jgi:hypothetical protein